MESSVWYEKYKPTTLDDVILPPSIKDEFKHFIESGEFPSGIGLWSSEPGLGKSSTANAIVEDLQALGHEAIWINASLEKGIDTLRGRLQKFATAASIEGKFKIVVMDECDHLTPDAQAAFRGFLDDFSSNCRFIFTGNYQNKIIEPLLDRLTNYDFGSFARKDIAKQIGERLIHILKCENVTYTKDDLIKVITTYYPRVRSMLVFLQKASTTGQLVVDNSLDNYNSFADILNSLHGDYQELWRKVNALTSPDNMYTFIYNNVYTYFGNNVPKAILIVAKYQHMASTVRDKHLNLMACLTELI